MNKKAGLPSLTFPVLLRSPERPASNVFLSSPRTYSCLPVSREATHVASGSDGMLAAKVDMIMRGESKLQRTENVKLIYLF